MLELNIEKTDLFEKLIKKLKKRYPNIENELDIFLDSIEDVKQLGNPLGNNLYKARIKNSDAQRGKSGGYRLISYLKLVNKKLTLVYIYSKSDLENIDESELDKLISKSFKD